MLFGRFRLFGCFCRVQVGKHRNGNSSALSFCSRAAIANALRFRGGTFLALRIAAHSASFDAFKRVRFVEARMGRLLVMDANRNGRALRLLVKSSCLLATSNVNSMLRVDGRKLSAFRFKEANVGGGRVMSSKGRSASFFPIFSTCFVLRKGRVISVFLHGRSRNVELSAMNNARNVPSFNLFVHFRFSVVDSGGSILSKL